MTRMKNKEFNLSTKTVWILLLGAFLLMPLAFLTTMQEWPVTSFFRTLGSMFFFAAWVILLNDMIKNNIYNKPFWIATLFIIPPISAFFYLLRREALLRLGQRLS